MTQEQFKRFVVHKGMKAEYRNNFYPIVGINFYEDLLCLEIATNNITWVRCDNVQSIK